MVVSEFHKALARSPETAVAVAAIKVRRVYSNRNTQAPCSSLKALSCLIHCWRQALTSVIERSEATTMMGLEKELKEAAQSLER